MLATYIKGQALFPEFSYVVMLDDIRILYYNGETKTLHPRGNTTTEEDVFDSNVLLTISDYIQSSFMEKWLVGTNNLNKTYGKYCNYVFVLNWIMLLLETLYTINYRNTVLWALILIITIIMYDYDYFIIFK